MDLAAVASFCLNDGVCVGRALLLRHDDDDGEGRHRGTSVDGRCMVLYFVSLIALFLYGLYFVHMLCVVCTFCKKQDKNG